MTPRRDCAASVHGGPVRRVLAACAVLGLHVVAIYALSNANTEILDGFSPPPLQVTLIPAAVAEVRVPPPTVRLEPPRVEAEPPILSIELEDPPLASNAITLVTAPTTAAGLPLLDSRSGASRTILLDVDGHATANTAWNQNFTGGATIVSLYLQKAKGWRAGKVQMAMDCAIVLLALTVVDPERVAYSVLAAVVMNLFIAVNHKPGRYAVL